MQDILQKLLTESKFIPLTKNLENVLFVKLQKKIRLHNRLIFTSYLTVGILSSFLLIIFASYIYTDLSNSGVYSYVHLIISEDINTLSLLSKEILYAILESLPMMNMTLTFGLMFMFTISFNGILLSLRKGIMLKN